MICPDCGRDHDCPICGIGFVSLEVLKDPKLIFVGGFVFGQTLALARQGGPDHVCESCMGIVREVERVVTVAAEEAERKERFH